MKVEINYVLNGNFVAKIIPLRSLDRVLANAEKAGAIAVTVSQPTPAIKKKIGHDTYRAFIYSEKNER